MTRQEVFTVIDKERNYQDTKWQGHRHSPTEYLVYMQHHLNKALAEVCGVMADGNTPALAKIRNVAAIAVACMEEHGAPER